MRGRHAEDAADEPVLTLSSAKRTESPFICRIFAVPYAPSAGSCENDRGIPGTGHIDWREIFRALRNVNYDGWLTIEGFGFSLGALSLSARCM